MASEMPADLGASIERLRRQTSLRRLRRRAFDTVFYGAIVLFAGWVFGQALDRTPPLTANVEIVTPLVKPGGKLAMRVEIVRHRICQSKITFRIYDGESKLTIVEMPWAEAAGGIGVDRPFVRQITLPKEATAGDAAVRIERAYRCPNNFFHQRWPITDTSPDLLFKIAPAGQPPVTEPER